MKKKISTLVMLGCLIALGAGCTQIDSGERGLERNWGKINPSLRKEGMHTYFPLGVDISIIDIKQKKFSKNVKTKVRTKDKQYVDVHWNLLYNIPESMITHIYSNYTSDPTDTYIRPKIETEMQEVFVKYSADELNEQKEKIRNELILKAKQSALTKKDGQEVSLIDIHDLTLPLFDFDDAYEKVISAKLVQKEKAEKKKYELVEVKTQAEIDIVKSKAQAEAIKAKTAALSNSPNYVELKRIEMMEAFAKKWDGKSVPGTFVTLGDLNKMLK